jgi:hypothetical protein
MPSRLAIAVAPSPCYKGRKPTIEREAIEALRAADPVSNVVPSVVLRLAPPAPEAARALPAAARVERLVPWRRASSSGSARAALPARAKLARPASTSRPIGIPRPGLQSKTACGCLSGRTILLMFARAILLILFNNPSAQRASRFEPSRPDDEARRQGTRRSCGSRPPADLGTWERPGVASRVSDNASLFAAERVHQESERHDGR